MTRIRNPAERAPRLGVDIGRVLVGGPLQPGADSSFLGGDEPTALALPPIEQAFESVTRLVRVLDGRVWLVSKCGPRIRERSLRWLRAHRFFERTGMDPEHARFCRERKEKAQICRWLGLTHFIDDRPDVLSHVAPVVERVYLFGPQPKGVPDWLRDRHVKSWPKARVRIERELDARVSVEPPQVLRRHGRDEPHAG